MILFKFEFFQEKITILLRLKATQNAKFFFLTTSITTCIAGYLCLVSLFAFLVDLARTNSLRIITKKGLCTKEPRVVKYPSGHQVIIINYSLMIT